MLQRNQPLYTGCLLYQVSYRVPAVGSTNGSRNMSYVVHIGGTGTEGEKQCEKVKVVFVLTPTPLATTCVKYSRHFVSLSVYCLSDFIYFVYVPSSPLSIPQIHFKYTISKSYHNHKWGFFVQMELTFFYGELLVFLCSKICLHFICFYKLGL